MTPVELKEKRRALGLSAEGFARMVRVQSGRTVRRWESQVSGAPIQGSVLVLLDLIDNVPGVKKHLGLGDKEA